MSTSTFKSLPLVAEVVHWSGIVLATGMVLLFAAFAVGLGVPPLPAMNASFVAVGVMLVGFVMMWWKDWLGGVVSLVGLGWFQALEFAANDRAAGGLFPLLVIPGALGIIAALTRYALRSRASTQQNR